MNKSNWLDRIALTLASIGAINWGLYTFNANIVRALPGTIANITYWIIAISGIWILARILK